MSFRCERLVEIPRRSRPALDQGRIDADTPSVSAAPPGWYPDPSNIAQHRWWDGYRWTTAIHPPVSRGGEFFRSLPWTRWLLWLAAIGGAAIALLTKAESRATHAPDNWYLAAVCIAAGLTLAASAATLRDRRWLVALVFAALVAIVVALAIFVTTAPATSRSCDADYDCDTGFGLGLPFVAAFLFVPAAGLSLLGKALAAPFRRRA